MEILAPAGSFESVKAAVLAGADAVYFGAGSFNARRNAENFDKDGLDAAVEYCHVRGALAYLTLNTLISDTEMSDALSLAQLACEVGIDGFIVQDLGLCEILKRSAPNMPLHASTQMSIHTLQGARLLHEYGFKRVVLSRECSKKDLQKISNYANKVGLELEIFVQGALCMSVSGQCLFSALLGGRSGNRGLCAGTCRLPFSVDNGNGYDLSLKDLNLYNYFADFEKMGIKSLKIEGRMKRPEYVAMAVDAAVAARDNAAALPDKLDSLQKIFSRSGSTDAYYTGKIGADMFGVRSEQDIDNSKEIKNSAHELYRRERARVAVDMALTVKAGENCRLCVTDGLHTAMAMGNMPQAAQRLALSADFAKEKLAKCGGTPYYLRGFCADIGDGLALAASELNRMKSAALDKLSALRAKQSSIAFHKNLPQITAKSRINPQLIGSFQTPKQIPDNASLYMYVLPLDTADDELQTLVKIGKNVAVRLPAYINDEDYVQNRLNAVKQLGISVALTDNLGGIPLIKAADMTVFGGSGLNIYNSYSAASPLLDNAFALTLSYELSSTQISAIRSKTAVCVNAYGRIPLMLIKSCPRRAHNGCKGCDGKITDRKGIDFRLMCECGATRLYSDRPLYIAERLREFTADYYMLNFTDETKEQAAEVIAAYKSGTPYSGSFTRGMYTKGVL